MSDCQYNAPNRGPDAGDVQTQRQQLDEQTREELIDKLVDCLYSLEGDTDTSAIDRCLEELEAAGEVCEDFDVERGLKDFHERFDAAFAGSPKVVKKKTSWTRRPLARIAIIAAVLCVLMASAQAAGIDVIGIIARWTSGQFSYVNVGETKDERKDALPFESLQDALDSWGIEEQLAPTEFPEGTEFLDVLVKEGKEDVAFSASYALEGEKFFVSIRQVTNEAHMEIEINDSDVEPYVAGGIEHHIMSDVKQEKVMWNNGQWECYIAGNFAEDDLLMMIDSIYE